MMFVIGYLLVCLVLASVILFLIDRSPAGWEDENGFHPDIVKQQQQKARSQTISISKSFENLYHSPVAGS
jgi:hypothetical protein